MQLVRVELFNYRIDDEVSAELIEGITDVMCDVIHESMRDHTLAIVDGHSRKNLELAVVPGRLMRWRSKENPRSTMGETRRPSDTACIEED